MMSPSKPFPFDLLPLNLKENIYDWCHLDECLQMLSTNRSLRHSTLSRGPFTKRLTTFQLAFEQTTVSGTTIFRPPRDPKFRVRCGDFVGDPLESLLECEKSFEKRMKAYRLLVSTIRYCKNLMLHQHSFRVDLYGSGVEPDEVRLSDFIPPIRHVRLLFLSDISGCFLRETPALLDPLYNQLLAGGLSTIDEAQLELSLFNAGREIASTGLRQLLSQTLIPCDCKVMTFHALFEDMPFMHIFDEHPIAKLKIFGGGLFGEFVDWHWAVMDLLRSERDLGRALNVQDIDLRSKVLQEKTNPSDQYQFLLSSNVLGDLEGLALQEITNERDLAEEIKKSIALDQPIESLDSRVWQPHFSMDQPKGRRRFYVFQAFLDESGDTWFNFRPLLA